jgi:hypothetical protein
LSENCSLPLIYSMQFPLLFSLWIFKKTNNISLYEYILRGRTFSPAADFFVDLAEKFCQQLATLVYYKWDVYRVWLSRCRVYCWPKACDEDLRTCMPRAVLRM